MDGTNMLSGNLYVYNKDGYVYVQAENCGDTATLTHNVFASKAEADTVAGHDDHFSAVKDGGGQIDPETGNLINVIVNGQNYQHGVPVPAGTPDNPQYGAYRLKLGITYGDLVQTGHGAVTVEPGKFLRVGFRYNSNIAVEIPPPGEVKVIPYTDMTWYAPQNRGPAVAPKIGSGSKATSTIAALMMAKETGVMVNGQMRVVPRAHPQNAQQLLGWEIWFENNAPLPIMPGTKMKSGLTGTIVMINPALPDDKNGSKNAGLGLESMACPEGGTAAMQFIRAGGDYGRADFGIEAQPGASFRAGIRGYSSYVGTLPSLQEGEKVIPLASFERGSAVDNMKFFDKDELEKKLGEKKNRVQFFKGGQCINAQLAETIYRGNEAFQTADLPPPQVTIDWVEDADKYKGGGWRIVMTNPLPRDPNDATGESCADKLGKLSFTGTLKLKDGDKEGKDFTKLPTHKFLKPGEQFEWFLPAGSDLNGVTAEAGRGLQIGTRGMGWLANVQLPAPGQHVDTNANDETKFNTWELWETQHERARLYPDYVPV